MIDPKILEQLKSLGIDPSSGDAQWVTVPPMDVSELPTMRRQRELMEKVRDVLKGQLEADIIKLGQAHEDLERLKNGGGV